MFSKGYQFILAVCAAADVLCVSTFDVKCRANQQGFIIIISISFLNKLYLTKRNNFVGLFSF
jgi:hypothetical protein